MKPKLIMIGGFLGAGKTTCVLRFGRWLASRGNRVAVVTNDQGSGLVDSSLARAESFHVEEIAGGCFCCRSQDFEETIRRITERSRPNIIIAEPVGSCTDLLATVVRPIRTIYKVPIQSVPLSVVVDPASVLHMFGLESRKRFAPEIEYIIQKQMEEAEVIVINKSDLWPPEKRKRIETKMTSRFPKATVFSVSARTGQGCNQWFEALLAAKPQYEPTVEVDYEKYAVGEELLGWYNGIAIVSGHNGKSVSCETIVRRFAEISKKELLEKHGVIAHFKAILSPIENQKQIDKENFSIVDIEQKADSPGKKYCVVQIGGPNAPTTIRTRGPKSIKRGLLTINIRCQTEPSIISEAVSRAIKALSRLATIELKQSKSFKPGKPAPTHRIAVSESASALNVV